MLRLLSSNAHERKYFWKPSKPCQVGTHWIALMECSQMNTHMPGFQWFFRIFAIFCIGQLSLISPFKESQIGSRGQVGSGWVEGNCQDLHDFLVCHSSIHSCQIIERKSVFRKATKCYLIFGMLEVLSTFVIFFFQLGTCTYQCVVSMLSRS